MQYEIIAETSRGAKYVRDRRSVAPPIPCLQFTTVTHQNEPHTIAPNRAFANEVLESFLEQQLALGVSEIRRGKLLPYRPEPDRHACEIDCGYCPICGASDGT